MSVGEPEFSSTVTDFVYFSVGQCRDQSAVRQQLQWQHAEGANHRDVWGLLSTTWPRCDVLFGESATRAPRAHIPEDGKRLVSPRPVR